MVFHPFQVGLVYRKTGDALFVATRDGTVVVRQVLDDEGSGILESIELGQRLYTPQRYLEEAMRFHAVYSAESIEDGHSS